MKGETPDHAVYDRRFIAEGEIPVIEDEIFVEIQRPMQENFQNVRLYYIVINDEELAFLVRKIKIVIA